MYSSSRRPSLTLAGYLTIPPIAYIYCIQMTTKSIQRGSLAESLITSQARLAVLKLMFLNEGRRFYLREVATRTRLPVRAVQRELARLQASGLLTSTFEGKRKYYQANRQAPIFPEVKSLLIKTVGLGDLLRDHMQKASGEIAVAFLFGSYALGTATASSDVDLMVVGSISSRSLTTLLKPALETLGREINPVVFAEKEFRNKAAHGSHFLLTVLGEPKIFLIGGENDLERIAGRRPTSTAQDQPQGS